MKLIRLLLFCGLLCACIHDNVKSVPADSSAPINLSDKYRTIANKLKPSNQDVSTHYIILVDYSIPSNKPRFFIWDYNKNKIIHSLWCAHGFGGGSTDEKAVFSNVIGSNCSSLGKFLIDRSQGQSVHYNYKYHALDGLDHTNSNARRRQLLIHAWASVTNDSISRITKPMSCDYRSAGCFTLTQQGYEAVDNLIKQEKKRILLYAFNGLN